MKTLTIRKMLEFLGRSLGADGHGPQPNGLARLAGTWSENEQRRFDDAVGPFEKIDDEMWA